MNKLAGGTYVTMMQLSPMNSNSRMHILLQVVRTCTTVEPLQIDIQDLMSCIMFLLPLEAHAKPHVTS